MSMGGSEFVSFYVLREKGWIHQINNILFLRHQKVVHIPLMSGLANAMGMSLMKMMYRIF
jgi:hypothetical protein